MAAASEISSRTEAKSPRRLAGRPETQIQAHWYGGHPLPAQDLSEQPWPCLEHRSDVGGGKGFRDADERDILRVASRIARGAGDPLAEVYEAIWGGFGSVHVASQGWTVEWDVGPG
jgi:hypothetical protein